MKKIVKKLYPKDTMTSEERLQAVHRLQVPDRVPVVPSTYYFYAKYAGIPNADLYKPRAYREATLKLFDELGPWDAQEFFHTYFRELVAYVIPMITLEPGFEG